MKTFSPFCVAGYLAAVWVATCGASEPGYYAFQLDGKPIGFAETTADEVTWDGRQVERLRCVTTLKFAMLGTTRTTIRRSTTLVEPKTGLPLRYELTQDLNSAVTHIESRFDGKTVQTWQWAEGAPKGDPKETPLESDTHVMGSNDFAHWNVLTRAASAATVDGTVEFTVFLPDAVSASDAEAIQKFRLVRGDAEELKINDTSVNCQKWTLEGQGMELFVSPQNGQLVKMNLPASKATVTLSDKSVAETTDQAGVPEILAQHFVQSNVAFDDFLKVRMLQAKIDVSVIGSGIANAPSILSTAIQDFEGEKKNESIQGMVTIHSKSYGGINTIPFPTTEPADPEQSQWLMPGTLIESDDPAIVALAKELTADVHDRWQAVLKVAGWVNKEISYVIADSPSARMALEKRKGDCGPHATLTVALLRSVGIPAKLVGGLVYTPSFGGTFGQHAWVEVFMGDDGWIALDPTTGEHELLSATHIKLFEGMGGVVPKQVDVLAYEPPNRELAPPAIDAARPLSWQLDKDYTYTYLQNQTKLGTQVFRITKVQVAGKDCFEINSTLALAAQGKRIRFTTRLVVQPNAIPVSFRRDYQVDEAKDTVQCEFQEKIVSAKITGRRQLSRDIPVQPGTYCFDNNFIPSFALICSQFTLAENSKVDIRTFHPSSLQVIPLSFQIKEVKKIQVSGREVECFECLVEPIKNTFWITRDGRLMKVEAAGLSIDVSPVD